MVSHLEPSTDLRSRFMQADVESIDFSALQVLYEVIETYKDRGVNVYIVHAGPEARALLTRAGIVELISRRSLILHAQGAGTDILLPQGICSQRQS